jgi:hypothetical protein
MLCLVTGNFTALLGDSVEVPPDDNSFNSGWLFRMDAGDTAPFPETPDIHWLPITLPHIQSVKRTESASSFASYRQINPAGVSAWYRRHVTLPDVPEGKMIFLTVCGGATGMRIWVNGHKFDSAPAEKNCIEFNITQRFRVGPNFDNVIAIEHQGSSSGIIAFPGESPTAGISLSVRNRVHLIAEQLELVGLGIGQDQAHIRLRTAVANHRESPAEVIVQNRLFSSRGELVGKSEQTISVSSGNLSAIADDIYFPVDDIKATASGGVHRVTTTLLEDSRQLDQIESIRDDAGFTEIRRSHLDLGKIASAK